MKYRVREFYIDPEECKVYDMNDSDIMFTYSVSDICKKPPELPVVKMSLGRGIVLPKKEDLKAEINNIILVRNIVIVTMTVSIEAFECCDMIVKFLEKEE